MSSESSDTIEPPLNGLLQPYLDGELEGEERTRVEREIEADPVLAELVREQLEVQEALRALPPISAPQAMKARILLELDAVDSERELELEHADNTLAFPPRRQTLWARAWAATRGAMVMVPATAAAVALFFAVRGDAPPPAVETPAAAPVVAAAEPAPAPTEDGPLLDADVESGNVPIHVAQRARGSNDSVELVGLEVPNPQAARDRGWTARAVYQAHARPGVPGPRIVDLQRRAVATGPQGTHQKFRGRSYHVSLDVRGRAVVEFVADGTLHQLSFESGPDASRVKAPGTYMLLDLGHRILELSDAR